MSTPSPKQKCVTTSLRIEPEQPTVAYYAPSYWNLGGMSITYVLNAEAAHWHGVLRNYVRIWYIRHRVSSSGYMVSKVLGYG